MEVNQITEECIAALLLKLGLRQIKFGKSAFLASLGASFIMDLLVEVLGEAADAIVAKWI